MSAVSGSLLTELDLGAARFVDLVTFAAVLKHERAAGHRPRRLRGRQLALVFEKNSTRTRCAFEVAAADEGASTTFIGPEGSHLGREESVADTAHVLGRLYDGIAYRGHAQRIADEFAANAGVPVWNALTDEWHPTQLLADVLTMTEHHDSRRLGVDDVFPTISVCFTGDGRNNVARSLLVTAAMLGMDVRIAAPPALQPPADVRTVAEKLGGDSGARILVTDDVRAGVAEADFVYTDVWLSMGEPEDLWAARIAELLPYRVTAELMAATGNPHTRFLHCLPSLHDGRTALGAQLARSHPELGDGVEVADEVFRSRASVVFDQAENRMHTIKAVLVTALGG